MSALALPAPSLGFPSLSPLPPGPGLLGSLPYGFWSVQLSHTQVCSQALQAHLSPVAPCVSAPHPLILKAGPSACGLSPPGDVPPAHTFISLSLSASPDSSPSAFACAPVSPSQSPLPFHSHSISLFLSKPNLGNREPPLLLPVLMSHSFPKPVPATPLKLCSPNPVEPSGSRPDFPLAAPDPADLSFPLVFLLYLPLWSPFSLSLEGVPGLLLDLPLFIHYPRKYHLFL